MSKSQQSGSTFPETEELAHFQGLAHFVTSVPTATTINTEPEIAQTQPTK